MSNKLTPEELFYKQFWKHPCDCGYFYYEDRDDCWLYARSKEVATRAINEQRKMMFKLIFWGVLALFFVLLFIFVYVLYETGSLLLMGVCLIFSIIGLIGTLWTATQACYLRENYRNVILFLKK